MRRLLVFLFVAGLASPAGADLDTKQKRGSVVSMGQPGRPWLAEPDGTLASTDRMSLMTYAAAVAPAAPGGVTVPPKVYYYEQLRAQEGQP